MYGVMVVTIMRKVQGTSQQSGLWDAVFYGQRISNSDWEFYSVNSCSILHIFHYQLEIVCKVKKC